MIGRFFVTLVKHGVNGVLRPDAEEAGASSGRGDPGAERVIALDQSNALVKGRHGWFLANAFDHYLGLALVEYGEYGEIEHAFLDSLVSPGDHVIEVGANIGSHTVGLAKAVGTQGSVLAIEPQPAIYRVLCANLALNALSNVASWQLGCGAQAGSMRVPNIDYQTRSLHNSGAVSLESDGPGIPVSIVPLDELGRDLPSLRLLKIDVEGMEREVLEGARGLIQKHRPLLYVENDRFEKSPALIQWILDAQYRLWWHLPPLFNPANYFGVTENIYGAVVSINVFCVPREMELPVTGPLLEVTDPAFHIMRQ
jgi:FkbM family methyltransferase